METDELSHSLDLGSNLKQEKVRNEVEKKQDELKDPNKRHDKQKERKTKTKIEMPSWMGFFQKHQIWIYLILILIVLIGVRFYAADLNTLDDLAKRSEETALLNQITAEVNEQYYFYSNSEKQNLISQLYLEQVKGSDWESGVEDHAVSLKESYIDPDGFQYLYGVDPYYNYKAAENKDFDMVFPVLEYYFYKIWSFFDKDITLFGAIFYLPLVFMILLSVVMFFFIRYFFNNGVAFFTTLFFIIHPFFLQYSLLGMVDTNVLNVLLLVLGAFVFLQVFEWKNKQTIIIGSVFLILIVVVFKYTWSGYYSLLALILTTLFLYGVIFLFHKLTSRVSSQYKIGMLIVSIFVALFALKYGYTIVLDYLPNRLLNYLHIGQETYWPDAYLTIKELSGIGFSGLVELAGGKLLALVSFIGFVWMAWKAWTDKNKCFLLLFVWYSAFFIISLSAVRFFPFFIPVFCIMFGFAFYNSFVFLLTKAEKLLNIDHYSFRIFLSVLLLVVLALPVFIPFSGAISEAGQILPIVDDSVYGTAIAIKENSDEDSIISVWWDRGHIFNALADRDVHIKASPRMPQTYWLATFLTTDDEDLAVGIIRMLNCKGSTKVFNSISNSKGKLLAIPIMKQVLSQDKLDLLSFLEENELSENIFGNIYCEQSDTYVVLIDDLLPKFHVIQEIAFWNFGVTEAPELVGLSETQTTQLLQQDYGMTEEEAKLVYYELFAEKTITPIEQFTCVRKAGDKIDCNIMNYKFEIDLEKMEAFSGQYYPKEFFFVEEGIVYYNNFESNTLPYSLIVFDRTGTYTAVMIRQDVAYSMYIRMLLLEGTLFENFEKFTDSAKPETKHVVSYILKDGVDEVIDVIDDIEEDLENDTE
jgi:dolichyl-phosphooligosaccharide-protein glycotransferase